MKKEHRRILSELCAICNSLGGMLDYTATNEQKLRDRQKAHMLVCHVLAGVLVDQPENDMRKEDMDKAIKSLAELEQLTHKIYPDRIGYLNPKELNNNG